MREICFDTETTGLDPRQGHKVVEIGCVELVNRVRTGNNFHVYINPRRDMPEAAFKVHGLSNEFLKDKPIFAHISDQFLDFIKDAKIIAHNAPFDVKFLNFELDLIGKPPLVQENVIDTLHIARNSFPGASNTLDALCKRFNVDLSKRDKHGALLDSELLADVYIELKGGAQEGLKFDTQSDEEKARIKQEESRSFEQNRKKIASRNFTLKQEEIAAHKEFITKHFKENLWGY